MTFVSFKFLAFVIILVFIYYVIPQKFRWIILLIGSIVLYLQGGKLAFCIVLVTTVVAYVFGIYLEKNENKGKNKQRLILYSAFIIVLGLLIISKLYLFYNWNIPHLVIPIGISYYTFSLVSYLTDIFWKKYKAERNFFKFALFVLYFPKILQGPISRYNFLGNKLVKGSKLSYKNITFGTQLIIWGFFKKIVIADRAAIIVGTVYGNLEGYSSSGSLLFITIILSAVQLYCDFSGYMDIAAGISQLFGIEIESNFKRPFLSRSVSEFWRRWHITLSDWFKDYIYMPVVISAVVAKISTYFRNIYGRRVGKAFRNVIPLCIVWILTGLWHGTGINYLIWGVYWAIVMIIADVFAPEIQGLNKVLHINTDAPTWRIIQIVRTTGIFCIGKLISSQNSLQDVWLIIKSIIKHPNFVALFDGSIYNLGLNKANIIILLFCIIILYYVGNQQEKDYSVRERIAMWNAIPRWIFYGISLIVVLFLGIYGAGYDTSSFAYMFF